MLAPSSHPPDLGSQCRLVTAAELPDGDFRACTGVLTGLVTLVRSGLG
jgi:hypothetical protein